MKKMLRNNIPAIAGLISASLILVAITSITPMNMMALAGGLPMGFASLGLASTGVTPVDIPTRDLAGNPQARGGRLPPSALEF